MVSKLFLGMSLVGAEWVLWLLIATSVASVAVIIERILFFRQAQSGLNEFREQVRKAVLAGKISDAASLAAARTRQQTGDLEGGVVSALLQAGKKTPAQLSEIAQDEVVRARLGYDKNLALLATVGSNAPFVGLFGTVLGIIKAFHDLSTQGAGQAGSAVTGGMADALIATAIGIMVAIPAVVAFNAFQRRVKVALAQAEALKSFLIGNLAE